MSDKTTMTTPWPHGLKAGDKIKISGLPNAVRTFVRECISQTAVALRQVRRPSRGYARHQRRMKELAR